MKIDVAPNRVAFLCVAPEASRFRAARTGVSALFRGEMNEGPGTTDRVSLIERKPPRPIGRGGFAFSLKTAVGLGRFKHRGTETQRKRIFLSFMLSYNSSFLAMGRELTVAVWDRPPPLRSGRAQGARFVPNLAVGSKRAKRSDYSGEFLL